MAKTIGLSARLKKTLINILVITIPSFVLLTLFFEVVFRTIIPATDSHPKHYFDTEWLLLKFEPNQTGTRRIGLPNEFKARYRINSEGWNSPIDYSDERSRKRRIAVIGDSYVAAFQLDPADAFPQVLEKKLIAQGHSVEVYRFGMSGVPMSQYVQ